MANFEKDIETLKSKLANSVYAQRMYATLCNNEFVKIAEAGADWAEKLAKMQVKHLRRTRVKRFIRWVINHVRTPFARYGYKLELRPHIFDGKTIDMKTMIPREPFSTINHWLLDLETKFWDFYKQPDWIYSCSWRYAGGMIADLRGLGEDYMDFYCSGGEGLVDPEIEEDLYKLGWMVADEEE